MTCIYIYTFDSGPYCHLIIQHSLFLFSTNCFDPGYNLILMPLFCISGTMTKTRSPHVVPKFGDARESSRALVDDKESKKAVDQRARNNLTS